MGCISNIAKFILFGVNALYSVSTKLSAPKKLQLLSLFLSFNCLMMALPYGSHWYSKVFLSNFTYDCEWTSCQNSFKCYFTYVFNLQIVAIVLVASGALILYNQEDALAEIYLEGFVSLIMVIVCGCLLFLISLFGCCGVIAEKTCLLLLVICFIIFIENNDNFRKPIFSHLFTDYDEKLSLFFSFQYVILMVLLICGNIYVIVEIRSLEFERIIEFGLNNEFHDPERDFFSGLEAMVSTEYVYLFNN